MLHEWSLDRAALLRGWPGYGASGWLVGCSSRMKHDFALKPPPGAKQKWLYLFWLLLYYSSAKCLNVHLDVCRQQMWQVERSRGPWHGPPQPCKLGGSVLSACVGMPLRECCTGGLPAAKPSCP